MLSLAGLSLLTGCWLWGDSPRDIAEHFWDANQDGDMELASAYVSSESSATVKRPDDGGMPMESYSLGAEEIDGDRATVETAMTANMGSQQLDVDFQTHLVREDGEWKVDLDRTTSDIMRAALGVTMEEMGEMVGEAMKGAMEGLAEGLQEGMDAMGEAISEAAEEAARTSRNR
jgi:hypothetical protein